MKQIGLKVLFGVAWCAAGILTFGFLVGRPLADPPYAYTGWLEQTFVAGYVWFMIVSLVSLATGVRNTGCAAVTSMLSFLTVYAVCLICEKMQAPASHALVVQEFARLIINFLPALIAGSVIDLIVRQHQKRHEKH